MDTVLAGVLAGLDNGTPLLALHEEACEALLSSPRCLCLECGGSGRVDEGNFDHHGITDLLPCACEQAWHHFGAPAAYGPLVRLVSAIDTGCRSMPFPSEDAVTFSSFFTGMLLCEPDNLRRVALGASMLREFSLSGLPPDDASSFASHAPRYAQFLRAWQERRRLLAGIAGKAISMQAGDIRVMAVRTSLHGIHGALRQAGADVSIAGTAYGRLLWTVSTQPDLAWIVQNAIPILNFLESGWGGPAGGSIIASPRKGSRLCVEEILSILKDIILAA